MVLFYPKTFEAVATLLHFYSASLLFCVFQGTSCILTLRVAAPEKECSLPWQQRLSKCDTVFQRMGGGGKKKRRKGDSGEEVGKWGREGGRGVGDFPLTFSNTRTHTNWLCRQLPWENPRPISQGGAFRANVGHMVTVANWALVIWFKLWVSQVRGSVGTGEEREGRKKCRFPLKMLSFPFSM